MATNNVNQASVPTTPGLPTGGVDQAMAGYDALSGMMGHTADVFGSLISAFGGDPRQGGLSKWLAPDWKPSFDIDWRGAFMGMPGPEAAGTGGAGAAESAQEVAPNVPEQQPFDDYSMALLAPYYQEVVGRLGEANPYDVRMNQILQGPTAQIDLDFDQARANLENRFAVMGGLDSPAFKAQMEQLERDRAQAKLQVQSQFGMGAAGAEEGVRRGRISDLGTALQTELGRGYQEASQQMGQRQQAMNEFNNYFSQLLQGTYQPMQMGDEGLRYLLGGLGYSLTPGQAMGGALQGYSGAGQTAMGQFQQLMQFLNQLG